MEKNGITSHWYDLPELDPAGEGKLLRFLSLCSDLLHEEYAGLIHRMGKGFGVDIATSFTGGKEIRPALVFLTNSAMLGVMRDAVGFAVPIQLLHNATLTHDDILDGDENRRGAPALWKGMGSIHDAILIGDAGFAMSIQTLARYGPQVAAIFGDTLYNIVRGAAVEMRNIKLNKNWVTEMAHAKTAALFAASAQFGAISARANPEMCEIARQYGVNVGLAFQFADDVSDIMASQEAGTPIGDLLARRPSLPIVLLALKSSEAGGAVAAFLDGGMVQTGLLEMFNNDNDILPEVMAIINGHLGKCNAYVDTIEATYGENDYTEMMRTLPLWGVTKMLHDKTSAKVEVAKNGKAPVEDVGTGA